MPRPAHFLHIGKTGGSAIKHALGSMPDSGSGGGSAPFAIKLHRHSTRLRDVPAGEAFFFFTREPVSRFVSAFWSRQRKGRPRYKGEWSPAEREAFGAFATPDELATALSSTSTARRSRAEAAMRSIVHVRDSYWKWFDNEAYFLSRRDDLLFVGCQHRLDRDFEALKSRLGLPDSLALPGDEVLAHVTPRHLDRTLQETAVRNLRAWYREDYRFLDLCRRVARER